MCKRFCYLCVCVCFFPSFHSHAQRCKDSGNFSDRLQICKNYRLAQTKRSKREKSEKHVKGEEEKNYQFEFSEQNEKSNGERIERRVVATDSWQHHSREKRTLNFQTNQNKMRCKREDFSIRFRRFCRRRCRRLA